MKLNLTPCFQLDDSSRKRPQRSQRDSSRIQEESRSPTSRSIKTLPFDRRVLCLDSDRNGM